MGGGGLPKNYSDEGGGHAKKIGNWGGGHTIFKLHSSKSHQPALPHKKWTVPYFLKSTKKILYAWANKISQHSESSLEA